MSATGHASPQEGARPSAALARQLVQKHPDFPLYLHIPLLLRYRQPPFKGLGRRCIITQRHLTAPEQFPGRRVVRHLLDTLPQVPGSCLMIFFIEQGAPQAKAQQGGILARFQLGL